MGKIVEIESLISPVLQHHNVDLVEIVLRGKRNAQVLEIFIDTANGVTTNICAEISREVSRLLDQKNIIFGKYFLVVSSPGIDRPLKTLNQFRKNVGRKIEIQTKDQHAQVRGILLQCDEQSIELGNGDTIEHIPFDLIRKATVTLPW